jgi:uncharacterized protein YneF (UPF0154 family)
MEQNQQIAILIALAIGLIAGYFISQRAAKHEKIYGGALPKALNYAASAAMITLAPSVLCSAIVLRNEFAFTILMVVVILGIGVISSMLFAVFENTPRKAALAKKVDRGWTEQDARTSGL